MVFGASQAVNWVMYLYMDSGSDLLGCDVVYISIFPDYLV